MPRCPNARCDTVLDVQCKSCPADPALLRVYVTLAVSVSLHGALALTNTGLYRGLWASNVGTGIENSKLSDPLESYASEFTNVCCVFPLK